MAIIGVCPILGDISEYVREQLPRTLRDSDIQIEIVSDPYHLRTLMRVKVNGLAYETQLETTKVGRLELACKIPELFLARLCAECP